MVCWKISGIFSACMVRLLHGASHRQNKANFMNQSMDAMKKDKKRVKESL